MLPREADRPEHRERVEHQFSRGYHRDERRTGRRDPLLRRRLVQRANGIPRRRRGELAVDQQRGGLVLQRLERADRFPELLASTQVLGDGVHAPPDEPGRGARAQGRRHAEDAVVVDIGQGLGDRQPGDAHDADVGRHIRTAADLDRHRRVVRVDDAPLGVTGGNQEQSRRADAERRPRRTAQHAVGDRESAGDHCGGGAVGDPALHGTRCVTVDETRHRARDDRRRHDARQQRRCRRLDDARGVHQRAALPADVLGEVDGVEAVGDELTPPRRQFTDRERVERSARAVEWGVPCRERGHRVGELTLFIGETDGHRGSFPSRAARHACCR